MSIEKQIDDLIAVMERVAKGLEGMGKASAPSAAPAAAAAPTAEAPKKGPGRPPKAKGPTIEDVTNKANEVLESKGKPAARALLIEHGSAGGKIAALPPENFAAFIAAADALMAEDPEGDEPAEDDDI